MTLIVFLIFFFGGEGGGSLKMTTIYLTLTFESKVIFAIVQTKQLCQKIQEEFVLPAIKQMYI